MGPDDVAALAEPPFDGRWTSVMWTGNGGYDAHLVDDQSGATISVCGHVLPFGPSAAAMRPSYVANGDVTCAGCLRIVRIPRSIRAMQPGESIPAWLTRLATWDA